MLLTLSHCNHHDHLQMPLYDLPYQSRLQQQMLQYNPLNVFLRLQGLFEQVLAMDDLEIFVRLMTQKNIELQQQALMLIMKTTGHLPDSLTEGGSAPQASSGSEGMMDDDEIMRRVLE